jgi:hypothetical protein
MQSGQSKSESTSELKFLFFESQKVPKFFGIPKNLLKTYFLATPLLIAFLTLIVAALLVFLRWQNSQNSLVNLSEFQSLQQQVTELTNTNNELLNEQKVYLAKIKNSTIDLTSETENASLSKDFQMAQTALRWFRANPLSKDLAAEKLLKIEQFSYTFQGNRLSVAFQLVNNHPNNQRVSGHAFIMLKNKKQWSIYPHEAMESAYQKELEFHQGETFSAQRLRPFQAEFQVIDDVKQAKIQIVFFTRTGDFLAFKEIDVTKGR